MRFLCYRVGFLGDIVMTTASLPLIKQSHPDCELTYVCWRQYAEILALNPHIDEIVIPGKYMVSEYDRWVDFRHEAEPPRFAGDCDPTMYWGEIHARQAGEAGLLDVEDMTAVVPELYIGPDDCVERESDNLVVINVWSANGINWRLWPLDCWVELVRAMHLMGLKVVQIGGRDDPRVEGVDAQLCGRTRIGQVIGVVAVTDLFVGIDSFPSHVAHAIKYMRDAEAGKVEMIRGAVPSVLLAGPIPSSCVVPDGADCYAVSAYPACDGPCGQSFPTEERPICEFGNSCMAKLPVEQVAEAVWSKWRRV